MGDKRRVGQPRYCSWSIVSAESGLTAAACGLGLGLQNQVCLLAAAAFLMAAACGLGLGCRAAEHDWCTQDSLLTQYTS